MGTNRSSARHLGTTASRWICGMPSPGGLGTSAYRSVCPKCISAMEPVVYGQIVVERCTGCRGLWIEPEQRQALQGLKGAAEVDDGDATVGQEFNVVDLIDCPRCRVRLAHLVDPQPPHVGYEQCPLCGGVYFDAGEFRSLSNPALGRAGATASLPDQRIAGR